MSSREWVILLDLLAIVFNLAVGMYVYRRRREDTRNLYFFAFACALAFLATFDLKAILAPPEQHYRWLSGAAIPAIFLPAFVFGILASQERRFREASLVTHLALVSVPVAATLLFLANLPSLFLRLEAKGAGALRLLDSDGAIPLLLALYVPLFLAGFLPLAHLREGRGFAHAFAVAVALPAFLGGCALHLLALPYLFTGHRFEAAHVPGILGAVALASGVLAAYAAMRHRGIEFEAIATRTVVFGVVTVTLSGAYVVLENALESFFAGILSPENDSFEILAALLIAACFGEVQSRAAAIVEEVFEFLRGGVIERSGDARARIARAAGLFAAVYGAVLLVGAAGLPVPGPFGYFLTGAILAATFLHLLVSLYRLEFHYLAYALVVPAAAALHVALVRFVPAASAPHPFTNLASLLLLVVAAFCLGRIIAVRIDVPAVLLPLVLLASALDVWSVYRGLTGHLIASRSAALDYLLVSYPAVHRGGVQPYIGVADFLFSSILLGAAVGFGFGAARTTAALYAGFLATFLTVAATGAGVPALPFLSLAFVAANARHLSFRLRDLLLVLAVGGGVVLVYKAVGILRVFAGS